jgi:tetratricopeptide (TPR) repeat protein
MANFAAPSAGRIFISYRREETAYAAGWLFDRLSDRFGRGQIFKDIDSVEPGDNFVKVITKAVASCDVLLALIGDRWLTITDEQGTARLDNPNDFVRLEIEAALARNVRVIPILLAGARMPDEDELPPSIAELAHRHALDLSPSHFEFETSRLHKVLERTLAEVHTQPAVVEPDIAAATPHARLRALYVEARAEMRLGQFQTAIDLLTDLLALDPNHRDASQLRDAATQRLHLAETFQRAADREAASEWAEAVHAYTEILEADPTFRDAATRREACEVQQQVSDLQVELRHHAAAAHWQAVLDVDAELARLGPSAADPDGLATQARRVLAEKQAHREAQLPARRQAEVPAQGEAQEARVSPASVTPDSVAEAGTAVASGAPAAVAPPPEPRQPLQGPPHGSGRRLVAVFGVAVIVIAGVVAGLVVAFRHTSSTSSIARTVPTSQLAPTPEVTSEADTGVATPRTFTKVSKVPPPYNGNSVVSVAPAAGSDPRAPTVVGLLTRYFTDINDRNFADYSRYIRPSSVRRSIQPMWLPATDPPRSLADASPSFAPPERAALRSR